MFKLSIIKSRWRISKDNSIIFSGIGHPAQAYALARVYGIVLTEFNNQITLKAA